MDEVKAHSEECMQGGCQHGTHSCGEMHQFCHQKCCFIKCLLVVIVLATVFAAGFCAGTARSFRSELYRGGYGGGYYPGQMMFQGGLPAQGGGWGASPVNVQYRMMGGVVPQTTDAPVTAAPASK